MEGAGRGTEWGVRDEASSLHECVTNTFAVGLTLAYALWNCATVTKPVALPLDSIEQTKRSLYQRKSAETTH